MRDWPLDPDEKLLWEGAPDTRLHFGAEALAGAIVGAVLVALAVGIVAVFGQALGDLRIGIIGGALVVAGLITILFPLLDRQARRNTRYALTDKRAFVWQSGQTNRIPQDETGWPLTNPDKIVLVTGPPDSIFFGRRPSTTRKGGVAPPPGFTVGFRRIKDGAMVHRLMVDIALQNTPPT